MTALTTHFDLHEFLQSDYAARMGRELDPPPQIVANLTRLCVTVLEPLRVKLARPMVITSGWRPDWLNAAIGGSRTSAHVRGFAADIKVVGMSPPTFTRWVESNAATEGWPIDQCILEFGQWTHIGIAEQPRGEYLTAKSVAGRTVYLPGVVS